ncbi:MAG: hypothetical protein WKF79_08245, partial [Nocardioides sp.]
MSDQEREPTPEQEAAVRRLLAEARHDKPIPAAVAARLDRVLVRLADPSADDQAGQLVGDELAARRRRRRLGSVLVAAAAVVAVGIGIGQVAGPQDDDVSGASDTAFDGDAADEGAPGAAAPSEETEPAPENPSASLLNDSVEVTGPQVRVESFAGDVRRYRQYAREAVGADELDRLGSSSAFAGFPDPLKRFACVPAPFGQGRLLPVLYDRNAAILA